MERNFFVLAYDIADDKRRAKIAKLCESLAERVQNSVFEAYLTTPELEKLVVKSNRLMKMGEDSLRIYTLCSACRAKIKTYGVGKVTPPPDVTIV